MFAEALDFLAGAADLVFGGFRDVGVGEEEVEGVGVGGLVVFDDAGGAVFFDDDGAAAGA